MKNGFIIFILLIMCLVSCSKQKQYTKIEENDENKYWDSLCLAETKRAKLDIQKRKLTYFHVFGMVETYRSNEEMNELLSLYNIGNDEYGYLCTAPSKTQNCYSSTMREEILRIHGDNFLDSLRNVAELKYVRNNINEIFPFEECDKVSRYPGTKSYDEFFDKYEEDFFASFEYPEDYIKRKESDEYYSYLVVEFVLHKNGNISNLKTEIKFQKQENYKYTNYFMKSVEKFVQNVKWIPATSNGMTVNSEMELYFSLK